MMTYYCSLWKGIRSCSSVLSEALHYKQGSFFRASSQGSWCGNVIVLPYSGEVSNYTYCLIVISKSLCSGKVLLAWKNTIQVSNCFWLIHSVCAHVSPVFCNYTFIFFLSISYQFHKILQCCDKSRKDKVEELVFFSCKGKLLPLCTSVPGCKKGPGCGGCILFSLMSYLKVMLEGHYLQGQYLFA